MTHICDHPVTICLRLPGSVHKTDELNCPNALPFSSNYFQLRTELDVLMLWRHELTCIFLCTTSFTYLNLGCFLMKGLVSINSVSSW